MPYYWGLVLWAQEDMTTPTTIIGAFILGFVSLMGLFGWMVRHLFTVTIPKMTDAFNGAIEKITSGNAETIKQMVQQCDKEQLGLRDLFDKRQEALIEYAQKSLAKEREASEARFKMAMEKMDAKHHEGMNEAREMRQQLIQGQQLLRELLRGMEARTRFADVVRSAEDAIWTKDLNGKITGWTQSAERLLGWRANEVVGKSVYEIIPPDLHGEERDVMEKLSRGERVERYSTERFHRRGHRVPLVISISPILDPMGKVAEVSSIARPE